MSQVSDGQDIQVGDRSYHVNMMSPTFALGLLARLVQVLGEAFVATLAGVDLDDKGNIAIDPDKMDDVFGAVARALCARLEEKVVVSLVKDCLSSTFYGPKNTKEKFDEVFPGRLGHLFSVVVASLKVQYADFFEGAVALAKSATAKE